MAAGTPGRKSSEPIGPELAPPTNYTPGAVPRVTMAAETGTPETAETIARDSPDRPRQTPPNATAERHPEPPDRTRGLSARHGRAGPLDIPHGGTPEGMRERDTP